MSLESALVEATPASPDDGAWRALLMATPTVLVMEVKGGVLVGAP